MEIRRVEDYIDKVAEKYDKIPKEYFINGTLDLLITEKNKGIELCEFFIK
mgnify:CR=1 FL=1